MNRFSRHKVLRLVPRVDPPDRSSSGPALEPVQTAARALHAAHLNRLESAVADGSYEPDAARIAKGIVEDAVESVRLQEMVKEG